MNLLSRSHFRGGAVAALAMLSVLAGACGGGGMTGTGDGAGGKGGSAMTGGGGGGGDVSPFPHGLCDASASFPAYVGKSCGAGANVSLCVLIDDGGSQCESTLCLWDTADPAGEVAYCTMPCDPSAADACPWTFSCKQDDCEQRHVCVRTEAPLSTLPYEVTPGALGPQPEGYVIAGVVDAQHTAYFLTSVGEVYRRAPDGSFAAITHFDLGGTFQPNGLVVIGDVVYAFGSYFEGYDRTGWIGRVQGSSAKRFDFDREIMAAFGTPDGQLMVVTSGPKGVAIEKASADLSLDPVKLPDGGEVPGSNITSLTQGGFVGYCHRPGNPQFDLCTGTNGYDTKVIGTSESTTANPVGTRPDDVWMLSYVDDLLHFDGTSWTTEKLPRVGYVRSAILPLTGGRAVFVSDSAMLYFDGSCWRSLLALQAPSRGGTAMVELSSQKVGWFSEKDFIELTLPGAP